MKVEAKMEERIEARVEAKIEERIEARIEESSSLKIPPPWFVDGHGCRSNLYPTTDLFCSFSPSIHCT